MITAEEQRNKTDKYINIPELSIIMERINYVYILDLFHEWLTQAQALRFHKLPLKYLPPLLSEFLEELKENGYTISDDFIEW